MSAAVVDSTRSTSKSLIWIGIGTALVGSAVIAAFHVGQLRPDVHTETLACLSAEEFISCGYPDSPGHPIVEVPRDVTWTDAQGTTHDTGRPKCLPPTGLGTSEARVSWVEFRRDGGTGRVVVSVTCPG